MSRSSSKALRVWRRYNCRLLTVNCLTIRRRRNGVLDSPRTAATEQRAGGAATTTSRRARPAAVSHVRECGEVIAQLSSSTEPGLVVAVGTAVAVGVGSDTV